MKACLCVAFVFASLTVVAQTDDKIERLPFCGWVKNNKKTIRSLLQDQFDFLAPQKGDTVVDIGAQSGGYEGCLAAAFDLTDVSFVLVDVDARCLNRKKVENMRCHYSEVKGDSIRNNFGIVINTQDSLYLPLDSYKTAWLMNTLHEVASPHKMARDIAAVLRPGGELCVLEPLPHKEGQLHSGCKKPLLKHDELMTVFVQAGFRLVAMKALAAKKKFTPVMYRFKKQ